MNIKKIGSFVAIASAMMIPASQAQAPMFTWDSRGVPNSAYVTGNTWCRLLTTPNGGYYQMMIAELVEAGSDIKGTFMVDEKFAAIACGRLKGT